MKKTSLLCQVWILFLAVFSSLVQATSSVQIEQQGVKQPEIKKNEVKQTVDVGVLAIRGHLYAEQRWQPTIDWLNKQISEVHFVLHPLNLDEMGEAVKFQTMDFIVTNPGQAVRLGRQYALSWMATLTSRAPQNSNYGIGSALVVRANSPYQTLKAVSGLPVAAVSEKAFGGYLTLRYQIVELGFDPNDFLLMFATSASLLTPIFTNYVTAMSKPLWCPPVYWRRCKMKVCYNKAVSES